MTGRDLPRADECYRCEACGERWYYTKPVCPACGADADRATAVPLGTGEVIATTEVHATPEDVRSPNSLGLVRFDDGTQVVAQVGDSAVEAGETVAFAKEYVLRDNGDDPVRGPRLAPAPRSDERANDAKRMKERDPSKSV